MINNVKDLFQLSYPNKISKSDLYKLIQYSKVETSKYWSGADFVIGNTPQQGINWIGSDSNPKGVILKVKHGSYDEDGWKDSEKSIFQYSFKSRNGKISYEEKANNVLIKQPQLSYPVLLFIEKNKDWIFQGFFSVTGIFENYVVLSKGKNSYEKVHPPPLEEERFKEGGRKYVLHMMAERNRKIIRILKQTKIWDCEICGMNFKKKFGVEYIEAHHKKPISEYSEKTLVSLEDFSLLCPNCHRAVHIYMKLQGLEYKEIKDILNKIKFS